MQPHPTTMAFLKALLVSLALSAQSVAAATGFTAQDRFDGFRFEIKGECSDLNAVQTHIVKAADQLACFGWVQKSPASTIVGEARCNKEGAAHFKQYLQRSLLVFYPGEFHTSIHQYSDTNIKLHFSDFRTLHESRKTCFDDLPHACSLYDSAAQDKADL